MLLSCYFKYITIEPSLFFFLIVYSWMKDFDSYLYLHKACQFERTIEPDIRFNNTCDDDKRGTLFVTEINLKFGFLPILLNIFISIFATGWSDKAGRKRLPLIYLPLVGLIFHTLGACVNSFFWKWHPIVAVLTSTICESLCGGVYLMTFACQLYVCDICDVNSRTMRLGLLGIIKLICQIFGKGGSGFVLRNLGFFHSYLLCFFISVFAFILSLILVKDTSMKVGRELPIYRMFNFKQVFVDNFKVVFHRKHGIKRIIIVFLITANISVLFTYFGLLFCSVVLSKWLHIHDSLIGVMAGFFDTIAILGLFFAAKSWQIYLIPLVDIFHGTAMVIGISSMTKYYDKSELGQLTAVNGVFSLVSSLCYPAYSITFRKTLDTLPSAFCLLSALIDVLIVLCFGAAYKMNKKYEKIKSSSRDVSDNAPTDSSTEMHKT